MTKFTVQYEIDYTYLMLFSDSDVMFIDNDNISFFSGKIGIPLSVGFVASRLARIEKIFGSAHFARCKKNIDEAYEKCNLCKKCIK